jgi:hypothetical protein
MKTKRVLCAVIVLALLASLLTACSKPVVMTETEVVIIAVKSVMEDADGTSLKAYMDALVKKNKLTYETSKGMLISLNGREAKAADNEYWMIYTSDSEYGSSEWGTYEYDGKTLKSASKGLDDLLVKEGEIYVFAISVF